MAAFSRIFMVFADVATWGIRNHAPIGFNDGLNGSHKTLGEKTWGGKHEP
jgi:hypothetical protein